MRKPPLPDRGSALFFDFDGTLTDLAARPEAVSVQVAVPQRRSARVHLLDAAVAIVSGPPVHEIEHHLGPLRLPSAGVHGADRRRRDGLLLRSAKPGLGPAREGLEGVVRRHPGLRPEPLPGTA
jgi:trehalose 6-phosphate phosphatase